MIESSFLSQLGFFLLGIAKTILKNFIYKLTRYEFWPWYCMYLPLLPVYFFGVLRTRRLLYFTATNPSIDMGGFFGEHKDKILDLIPNRHKALGVHITEPMTEKELNEVLLANNLRFPVVAKPNVGERGDGVCVLYLMQELLAYSQKETDFIIQEYIDYPIELGVLFYRYPNDSRGRVSSITLKEFLTVKGDGKHTVEQLLSKSGRNKIYLPLVRKEFQDRLLLVPSEGEEFVVHKIGNHSKGTRFVNADPHITDAVNATFSKINNQVDGVYFGRYDLKVPSFDLLERGEGIKIFELNGVSSEPGSMYDQQNVFRAYSILAHHWLALVEISYQNIKRGVETTPLQVFFRKVRYHFYG